MDPAALFEKLQVVEEQLKQLQIGEERRHGEVLRRLGEVKDVLEAVRVVAAVGGNRAGSAGSTVDEHTDVAEEDGTVFSTAVTAVPAILGDAIGRHPPSQQRSTMEISIMTETETSFVSCRTDEDVIPEEDEEEDSRTDPDDSSGEEDLSHLLHGLSFSDGQDTEEEDYDDDIRGGVHINRNHDGIWGYHEEDSGDEGELAGSWDGHWPNELPRNDAFGPYGSFTAENEGRDRKIKEEEEDKGTWTAKVANKQRRQALDDATSYDRSIQPKEPSTRTSPGTSTPNPGELTPPSDEQYFDGIESEPPKLDPKALLAAAFPDQARFLYRIQTSHAATTIPTPTIPDCPTCAYHASGFAGHSDTPPFPDPLTRYLYSDALIDSAYSHAQWRPEPSPFISVTNDLLRAFTIAVAGHHNTTRITVIDSKSLPRGHYWNLKSVLEDYSTRPPVREWDANGVMSTQYKLVGTDTKREDVARRAQMAATEFIIWQCIPESAVIAHWEWQDIKSSQVLPMLVMASPTVGKAVTTTTAITTTTGVRTAMTTATAATCTTLSATAPESELLRHKAVSSLRRAISARPRVLQLSDAAYSPANLTLWLSNLADELRIPLHHSGPPLEFLLHFGVMLLGFESGLGAEEWGNADKRHRWPKGLEKEAFWKLVEAVELEQRERWRVKVRLEAMRKRVKPVMAKTGLREETEELVKRFDGISLMRKEEEVERGGEDGEESEPDTRSRTQDTSSNIPSSPPNVAAAPFSSSPPYFSPSTSPTTLYKSTAPRRISETRYPNSPPTPPPRLSFSSPPRPATAFPTSAMTYTTPISLSLLSSAPLPHPLTPSQPQDKRPIAIPYQRTPAATNSPQQKQQTPSSPSKSARSLFMGTPNGTVLRPPASKGDEPSGVNRNYDTTSREFGQPPPRWDPARLGTVPGEREK